MICRIIEDQKDYLKNDDLISYPYKDNFYIQGISLFLLYEGPGVIVDISRLTNSHKVEIIEEFKFHKIDSKINIRQ